MEKQALKRTLDEISKILEQPRFWAGGGGVEDIVSNFNSLVARNPNDLSIDVEKTKKIRLDYIEKTQLLEKLNRQVEYRLVISSQGIPVLVKKKK